MGWFQVFPSICSDADIYTSDGTADGIYIYINPFSFSSELFLKYIRSFAKQVYLLNKTEPINFIKVFLYLVACTEKPNRIKIE